jgi:hypothetical protein
MSQFSEKLQAQSRPTLMQEIESALGQDSFADFVKAMNDENVAIPAIRTVLKEFGINVSENTLRRWRHSEQV